MNKDILMQKGKYYVEVRAEQLDIIELLSGAKHFKTASDTINALIKAEHQRAFIEETGNGLAVTYRNAETAIYLNHIESSGLADKAHAHYTKEIKSAKTKGQRIELLNEYLQQQAPYKVSTEPLDRIYNAALDRVDFFAIALNFIAKWEK